MANIVLSLANKTVILKFLDFEDEIDIDQLTSIDYSNLFGEAVTVSALMNKIGILKAEAESINSTKKLEVDIYAAELSRRYRREANINANKFNMPNGDGSFSQVKLTEESLLGAITLDPVYQNMKKSYINSKKDLDFLDSIYWAIKSKDTKLSVLLSPISPQEFYNELIEGKVNSMIIKKPIDNWVK